MTSRECHFFPIHETGLLLRVRGADGRSVGVAVDPSASGLDRPARPVPTMNDIASKNAARPEISLLVPSHGRPEDLPTWSPLWRARPWSPTGSS